MDPVTLTPEQAEIARWTILAYLKIEPSSHSPEYAAYLNHNPVWLEVRTDILTTFFALGGDKTDPQVVTVLERLLDLSGPKPIGWVWMQTLGDHRNRYAACHQRLLAL